MNLPWNAQSGVRQSSALSLFTTTLNCSLGTNPNKNSLVECGLILGSCSSVVPFMVWHQEALNVYYQISLIYQEGGKLNSRQLS